MIYVVCWLNFFHDKIFSVRLSFYHINLAVTIFIDFILSRVVICRVFMLGIVLRHQKCLINLIVWPQ